MTTRRQAAIERALPEWRAALGEAAVLTGSAVEARYGQDTAPSSRRIPAALLLASASQVAIVVRIAARHGAPLYPISTGRNWGYGTANPASDDCVVLDLSRLRCIIAADEELGIVTVEPGVTQHDLYTYLQERDLPFLVPVTGAGPECSILGNALERGYGITPITDHFQAITAIEAVLPDGEIYRTALTDLGAPECDQLFKWGVGPYLDGIFSQSGFGVVTRATIVLARKPERLTAFFFWVDRDDGLERAVLAVREAISAAGANLGGINLMNDVRMLSMSVPYPHDRVQSGSALSSTQIAELSKGMAGGAWTGVGSIHGTRELTAATRTVLKRILGPHVRRLTFVEQARMKRARAIVRYLPGRFGARLALTAEKLAASMTLMAGEPSTVALPLSYWKARVPRPADGDLNPARDGCGLYWYAPLVPMRAERVRAYVDLTRRICRDHGLEAPITLTSLSNRVFDSTVPLLFARDDESEAAQAQACFEALFEEGRRLGFLPYRIGVQSMDLMVRLDSPFWRFAQRLKDAVDPGGILAPGRYAIDPLSGIPERMTRASFDRRQTT